MATPQTRKQEEKGNGTTTSIHQARRTVPYLLGCHNDLHERPENRAVDNNLLPHVQGHRQKTLTRRSMKQRLLGYLVICVLLFSGYVPPDDQEPPKRPQVSKEERINGRRNRVRDVQTGFVLLPKAVGAKIQLEG